MFCLQLEVVFDSMAELEAFWAAIPPDRHRAWSQRAQHLIVDGARVHCNDSQDVFPSVFCDVHLKRQLVCLPGILSCAVST